MTWWDKYIKYAIRICKKDSLCRTCYCEPFFLSISYLYFKDPGGEPAATDSGQPGGGGVHGGAGLVSQEIRANHHLMIYINKIGFYPHP